MNIFSIVANNFWKIKSETSLFLKYFFHDCIWKQFFAYNLPQTPLNLIFLVNFGSSKTFNTVLT